MTMQPAAQRWRSCFVTGTDTNVGKTLVACALVHALAQRGARVAGMKPVAAGATMNAGAWRNDDVEQLAAAANVAVDIGQICPYVLEQAVAPHIAAARSGVVLQLPVMLQAYQSLRARCDAVLVEGVGGFRVPLGPGFDSADLARELGLPVVLVVGLRLGCLNHAALTAEAIAARGLTLLGWVANCIDPEMAEAEQNVRTLADLLGAACLGTVPWLAPARWAQAAAHLDVAPFEDAACTPRGDAL